MATHRAWFCSDVVNKLASYLPIADVFSLIGCGTRNINKLLVINTNHCLVITARDMDLFWKFMTLFENTRYVFIKEKRTIGSISSQGVPKTEMPKNIERFVAPKLFIFNLSFGSNIKYIISQYTTDCNFEVPPEKSVNLSGEYVDEYVTHVVTDDRCDEILEFTDESHALLHPRLQEIDVRQCVSDNQKVISKRVNISYTCESCGIDRNICVRCGLKVHEVFVSSGNLSDYDGVYKIRLANNTFISSTMPSSVTSVQIYSENDISNTIKCLPKTVTTLYIHQITVFSGLICSINPEVETITVGQCLADPLNVVKMIGLNCHKFQFDILTIYFKLVNGSFPREYTDMLIGNYHMTARSKQLIFERTRARNFI